MHTSALRVLPSLAVAAAVAVALSGFGARFGIWEWGVGFQILRWGALSGVAVAVVALVALLVPRTRKTAPRLLAAALVIGIASAAMPLGWLQQARSVPPINDITTDTIDPPAFAAIIPLRTDAPVPAAYPGEATARAQHTAYPDIQPLVVPLEIRAAFDAAVSAARQMGWEIVAADAAGGRIEAVATTPWFGFKDDVVVRITPSPPGSRIDVRSVSRVGKSDLGANARRIREFLSRI